jgi:tRNA threonylcarbamoyladenosine biosynthesis protein TsaE
VAESLIRPGSVAQTGPLPDPAATAALGAALAQALVLAAPARLVAYFEGDLGAGKTALIRALLAGLGHEGRVPSPTYTLVEPYLLAQFRVLHVDLYRLRDPAELDDLGLSDELGPVDALGRGRLLLVEWPVVALAVEGDGRRAALEARTPAGLAVLGKLQGGFPAGF